jgi:nicotinate-nucleotide adenylyltransferase
MKRIGILGGSFDPIHLGHVQGASEVLSKFSLDEIILVPNSANPLKGQTEGASAEDRLKMTEIALKGEEDVFSVDDREVKRGGVSYTVETLKSLKDERSEAELFFILGMDSFERFDEWKSFEEILDISNVIVMSRPGSLLPRSVDHLPDGIKGLVELFDPTYLELKSGKNIQFVQIPDFDVSSSDIRKKLRIGKNVQADINLEVEDYIKANKLYQPIGDKIGDLEEFVKGVGQFLDSKRALGIACYDLKDRNAPSDYVIICSGTSTRQATAIADYLSEHLKDEFGILPLSLEGKGEGRWVLLDYGSLIVHVFYDFVRGEYNLEELWKEAPQVDLGLQ